MNLSYTVFLISSQGNKYKYPVTGYLSFLHPEEQSKSNSSDSQLGYRFKNDRTDNYASQSTTEEFFSIKAVSNLCKSPMVLDEVGYFDSGVLKPF